MTYHAVEFATRCLALLGRYKRENAWYRGWADDADVVREAWLLYRSSNQSALGLLLLGRGPIRTSEELIANFGTATGSDTDGLDPEVIARLQARRAEMRELPTPVDTPDVVGTGSVLNDRNWSPLLNDAFVLGGAHGGCEFLFAEDRADQHFRTLGGSDGRAKWLDFLRTYPDVLWDGDNPRIFSRELLGLAAFGYEPAYVFDQLGFVPPAAGSTTASFTTYLDALTSVGFDARDRVKVLASISAFLFSDAEALTRPQA